MNKGQKPQDRLQRIAAELNDIMTGESDLITERQIRLAAKSATEAAERIAKREDQLMREAFGR